MSGAEFPRVEGKCPACGSTGTLFRGAGGYVTCSLDKCPDPGALDDAYVRGWLAGFAEAGREHAS